MKVSRVLVFLFFVFFLMRSSTYADTRVIEVDIDLSGMDDCMASSTHQINIDGQDIKLYPNPSKGNFLVSFGAKEVTGSINYQVLDLTGSVLQSGSLGYGSKKEYEISISGLNAGLYNLQLNFDGRTVNKKIIIVQ